MTSTWVDADGPGACHSWRAWGSKEEHDHIMEPGDILSTTCDLNRTSLTTWYHFPVVVKIDGKQLKAKKRKKGWAGWIPKSEDDRHKFQKLAFCPNVSGVGG